MFAFVLQNGGVHRSVKPQILSIFGDIALAVGPHFKNYLDVVLTTVQQATQAQVDKVQQCSTLSGKVIQISTSTPEN